MRDGFGVCEKDTYAEVRERPTGVVATELSISHFSLLRHRTLSRTLQIRHTEKRRHERRRQISCRQALLGRVRERVGSATSHSGERTRSIADSDEARTSSSSRPRTRPESTTNSRLIALVCVSGGPRLDWPVVDEPHDSVLQLGQTPDTLSLQEDVTIKPICNIEPLLVNAQHEPSKGIKNTKIVQKLTSERENPLRVLMRPLHYTIRQDARPCPSLWSRSRRLSLRHNKQTACSGWLPASDSLAYSPPLPSGAASCREGT
ncbi:hypothetical protein J6590_082955 [Homalodisca vitripennis]|nr:hypothetical protein J6590_082955 [Homalodisca vitripennis]